MVFTPAVINVFYHYYSAVQVDVFTVVYKKFDSLVSGEWKFPQPAVLLEKHLWNLSHDISAPFLSPCPLHSSQRKLGKHYL